MTHKWTTQHHFILTRPRLGYFVDLVVLTTLKQYLWHVRLLRSSQCKMQAVACCNNAGGKDVLAVCMQTYPDRSGHWSTGIAMSHQHGHKSVVFYLPFLPHPVEKEEHVYPVGAAVFPTPTHMVLRLTPGHHYKDSSADSAHVESHWRMGIAHICTCGKKQKISDTAVSIPSYCIRHGHRNGMIARFRLTHLIGWRHHNCTGLHIIGFCEASATESSQVGGSREVGGLHPQVQGGGWGSLLLIAITIAESAEPAMQTTANQNCSSSDLCGTITLSWLSMILHSTLQDQYSIKSCTLCTSSVLYITIQPHWPI